MTAGLIIGGVIGLIIGIPLYIFSGMGFYKLGKVTGYKYPGFAWVPILNIFLLLHLARQRKKPLGIAYIITVGLALTAEILYLAAVLPAMLAPNSTIINTLPFTAVMPTLNWVLDIAVGALHALLLGCIYREYGTRQRANTFTVWTWLWVAWNVASPWLPEFILITLAGAALGFLPCCFVYSLSIKPFDAYKMRIQGEQTSNEGNK